MRSTLAKGSKELCSAQFGETCQKKPSTFSPSTTLRHDHGGSSAVDALFCCVRVRFRLPLLAAAAANAQGESKALSSVFLDSDDLQVRRRSI